MSALFARTPVRLAIALLVALSSIFCIAVAAHASEPLKVFTGLSYAGYETTYSEQVFASGGSQPYTFSVVSGTLPTGLSMSSSGLISGLPTVLGDVTFVIQVKDSTGSTVSGTETISVEGGTAVINLQSPPLLHLDAARATLVGGKPQIPIANATVHFFMNETEFCSGVTNAAGQVSCKYPTAILLKLALGGELTAFYAATPYWGSTSEELNGLGFSPAPATL